MTVERLTPRDRANIEIMAEWTVSNSVRRTIRFEPDLDVLLAHGFELGFTGQSAFGTSKDGTKWQVAICPSTQGRGHNGGYFTKTTWYILDDDYRRTRVPSLTFEQFYARF